jgi:5'-nucleotidase
MTKVRIFVAVAVAVAVVASATVALGAGLGASRRKLHVLVTNDDGVGAPGIAAVVDALQALPNVNVRVIAPLTNQSGAGAKFSTTPLNVTPATTASGDAATAVAGFPADSVLYALLGAHAHPDVVVSGINQGQNLGNITEVSGTVGAARTANLLGVPAVAVSQGLAANINYSTAAQLAAQVVDTFRDNYILRRGPAQTLNLNVPSCPVGSPRGIRNVPLGQTDRVSGYTIQSGVPGNGTFAPTVVTQNPIATSNCQSTLANVTNDIQAFNNGFITRTTLNPNFTDPFSLGRAVDPRWVYIEQRITGH